MSKKIFSIGYEIPGNSDKYIDFSSEQSLMDADILLISPDSFEPNGDWVNFTSSDSGCYNIEPSKIYKQRIHQLKKELSDHLNSGRNVFLFLSKEEKYSLASGVTLDKKVNRYSTETYSNYDFLPIDMGRLTSASGKHIEFSGNLIFRPFYNNFKTNLEYQLYIESSGATQTIFTGKDKTKILGAVYKKGAGNLITLPCLEYDRKKFIIPKKDRKGEEKEYWSKEAFEFGHKLVDCLIQMDSDLRKSSDKTPVPSWALGNALTGIKEKGILESIAEKEKNIFEIKGNIDKLNIELAQEQILKDLLFEQGKPLENAVIKALKILGYSATNYDDGELELDQVIVSPEGNRYIGECEGKNEKAIDIEKLRQLIESMNADFAKEEVQEKAFGILFGNPQRLISPEQRTQDFTQKCKTGASREKIALVKTIDLFYIAKYLNETNNEDFKQKCREVIHAGLGKIVVFPDIPKEPESNNL
jgi:hypothetical protein